MSSDRMHFPNTVHFITNRTETEYRKLRSNKLPLGVKNVFRQRPADRPLNPSFRLRTKVFSLDSARREELLDSDRTFVGKYRKFFDDYSKAAVMKSRPIVEWPQAATHSPTFTQHGTSPRPDHIAALGKSRSTPSIFWHEECDFEMHELING